MVQEIRQAVDTAVVVNETIIKRNSNPKQRRQSNSQTVLHKHPNPDSASIDDKTERELEPIRSQVCKQQTGRGKRFPRRIN
jgi:hypothetical protein